MFSFLKRLPLHKLVAADGGEAAQRVLEGILRELPELLLACVVEVLSGKILASYTTHPSLNPNHLSLRYAKLLRTVPAAAWGGNLLLDMTLVLEDQLHYLRLLHADEWYCLVAVHTAESNLALTQKVVRRYTNNEPSL